MKKGTILIKDITGQKFGEWTVLKSGEIVGKGTRTWICQCSCGEIRQIPNAELVNGKRKICRKCSAKIRGQNKIINLSGRKIGEWTVI
jgi:predicted SprT family Zn-dependent metalloprotease